MRVDGADELSKLISGLEILGFTIIPTQPSAEGKPRWEWMSIADRTDRSGIGFPSELEAVQDFLRYRFNAPIKVKIEARKLPGQMSDSLPGEYDAGGKDIEAND